MQFSDGMLTSPGSLTSIANRVTSVSRQVFSQKTPNIVRNSLSQNYFKNYSLDELSKAGKVADRGELTKAGRALEKHGNRPDSVFPKAMGNPAAKNVQGQFELDNILTYPNGKISPWIHRNLGEIIDIEVPGHGGARFSQEGYFIGFLEPNR